MSAAGARVAASPLRLAFGVALALLFGPSEAVRRQGSAESIVRLARLAHRQWAPPRDQEPAWVDLPPEVHAWMEVLQDVGEGVLPLARGMYPLPVTTLRVRRWLEAMRAQLRRPEADVWLEALMAEGNGAQIIAEQLEGRREVFLKPARGSCPIMAWQFHFYLDDGRLTATLGRWVALSPELEHAEYIDFYPDWDEASQGFLGFRGYVPERFCNSSGKVRIHVNVYNGSPIIRLQRTTADHEPLDENSMILIARPELLDRPK